MDTTLENNIRQEIRAWSAHALERKNLAYNGFPPCPYAAKAWMDNKVDVQFKYDGDPTPLYTTLAQYDDDYELIIAA